MKTNTTLWNKHKYQGLGSALDVGAGSQEKKCGVCNLQSCICRIARLSPVDHCGALVMDSLTLVLDLADC